jgi:hypothetical protein
MPTPLEKIYYLNVGKHGTFQPSGNEQYDTTAADVDQLFDHLEQKGQKKLVIYFHGGLVNANSGMNTAERIVRYVNGNTSSHPVCFVWETGLLETIGQNFDTIGQSAFFKKLLVQLLKIVGKKLGIDLKDFTGAAKGVETLSDEEIEAELMKEHPFASYEVVAGKRSATLNSAELNFDANDTRLREEIQAEVEEQIYANNALIAAAGQEKSPEEARLMKTDETDEESTVREKGIMDLAGLITAAVKITYRVIKRHIQKRDHGFYPTIIEEIFREYYVADLGSWVWGRMKNKGAEMWKEDGFTGDALRWHAGTYFLKKLIEYQQKAGPLQIDLIGHSAGSIAICELIKAVNERGIDLNFRNIVFMAPAARCELFHETVLQEPRRFKDLRSFTMSDDYETKDMLVPVLYPRSLLYFISGVLEENENDAYVLGLQRHITGEKPYNNAQLKAIADFFKEKDRIVYSVTQAPGADGLRAGSQHHGDFDNDGELTLDSIMYLLK